MQAEVNLYADELRALAASPRDILPLQLRRLQVGGSYRMCFLKVSHIEHPFPSFFGRC